jgi:hypothetical protein
MFRLQSPPSITRQKPVVVSDAREPMNGPILSLSISRATYVWVVRALISSLALFVAVVTPAVAKEFEIDGSIDCGVPSGAPCPFGNPVIGVVTDSISIRRERVDVMMGLVIQQRLEKTKIGPSLLNDPTGVNRAAAFQVMQPILEQLTQLTARGISLAERERIAKDTYDESLPPELVRIRDILMNLGMNFKQDARIRLRVTDELAPILVATELMHFEDYQMSQSRPSGSVNLGQLTGTDSESFFCTDFIAETLDWAKGKIEKNGKLQLTDNEELFFELLAELPIPCTDQKDRIALRVINYIRWNIKAVVDDARKQLPEKEQLRRELLRKFFENPDARQKLIQFLKDTILKPTPNGRRPFKKILEDRNR